MLFIPLAVQWWSSYYPGSEPGGGGYIAQRMFSAKDESNAIKASLLFNIAHYAIVQGVDYNCTIIINCFSELDDIRNQF